MYLNRLHNEHGQQKWDEHGEHPGFRFNLSELEPIQQDENDGNQREHDAQAISDVSQPAVWKEKGWNTAQNNLFSLPRFCDLCSPKRGKFFAAWILNS